MDRGFVKDVFMDATDTMAKQALEGLSDSMVGDPKRCILPMQVPEVAKVQTMLVELIGLSRKFEANQLEFKKVSEQDEHIADEGELKIKSGHNTSKDAIEDLSALDKKCTEKEDILKIKNHSQDKGRHYPVKVSGVEISPDPVVRGKPATFKISASTGNLDEKVPGRVLYEILIQVGHVVDLHIPCDKETGRPKGFAFAEYETEAIAQYAVRLFSRLVRLNGKTLKICGSEIEYVEGDDIEMGDMDDMEDFEGFGDEDGKHFPCFY
ncbi:hypothetical protein ZWY2020_042932 [Hordeum vulgare]|nr:hypothetical protein ZWY2020_042932 [Hordeum vulgare]